jgi:hypothetical protein
MKTRRKQPGQCNLIPIPATSYPKAPWLFSDTVNLFKGIMLNPILQKAIKSGLCSIPGGSILPPRVRARQLTQKRNYAKMRRMRKTIARLNRKYGIKMRSKP